MANYYIPRWERDLVGLLVVSSRIGEIISFGKQLDNEPRVSQVWMAMGLPDASSSISCVLLYDIVQPGLRHACTILFWSLED